MILNRMNLFEIVYTITALITALGTTFLGCLVYFRNRKGKVNKSYALISLSVAIWSYGLFFCFVSSGISALYWARFLHIGAIFIPITFFYFVLTLLKIVNQKKKILTLGLIASLILLIFDSTSLLIKEIQPKFNFRIWPVPGIIYPLFLLFFFIYIVYAWILVFKQYRKSSDFALKNQLKYILIGSAIGFLGGSTNYPLFYNIQVPPVGNLFVFFYIVLFAYAIIRYRLM
ncbi:MAG: hypothetical protein J7K17_00670, partial [Candidatus Omnitrophica bacterium]|nr:hypothetical protein [Candidatus Omnitrophota bacterium]